jgi:hypothetical protein
VENTNAELLGSQTQTSPTESSSTQLKKSKPKFRIILIIFGLFVFLLLSYFLKEYLVQDAPMSGWKVNECIYEGYKISYPGDMTPHNIFPLETSCVSQYGYWGGEEPIFISYSDKKISADKDHIINNDKEITINGIKARYLEMEINRDLEMQQFFVYEYPGNDKYYHLYLNLNYKDPRQDLDFYKDTEWGQMVDETVDKFGNKENKHTAASIENIFHKMAQTFVLTTPKPIPVSELEK